MSRRRYSKKKGRKAHWIYPGDLCWLKPSDEKYLAYPAEDDWTYTDRIMRVMLPEDPIVYVKRSREGRGGPWTHHIECLGLKYVFKGSIHCFTKTRPANLSE